MPEKPEKEIVAAGVITDRSRVLLVQQREPRSYGQWGYPGGHTQSGESIEDTVRREVLEETGLRVSQLTPLRLGTRAPNFEHHAFDCNAEGEIKIPSSEILGIGWFSLDDLERMKQQLRADFILDIAKVVLEA